MSLVRTLTTEVPTIEALDTRTIGIDLFPWTFSRDVDENSGLPKRYEIAFWDFGGQDVYRGAFSIFYSQRTLFLLCIDLEQYAGALDDGDESELDQLFQENILCWFRLVIARQPDAHIVLVGTKSDAEGVSHKKIELIKQDAVERLRKWIERNRSTTNSWNEGQGMAKTKMKARNHSGSFQWLITSSKDASTVEDVRVGLQKMIIEKKCGFEMPEGYYAVLEEVRRLRKEAKMLPPEEQLEHIFRLELVLRREFLALRGESGRDLGLTMDKCKHILRTLHDLGDVLYFENDRFNTLRDIVILDPNVIIDMFRQIIRHDHTDQDPALRTSGYVSNNVLKTLSLWKNIDCELTLALKKLLQHFRLAYPAGVSRMTPEADLIVPALWSKHHPVNQESLLYKNTLEELSEANPDENGGTIMFSWEYDFPNDTLPQSFFEEVIVESYLANFQPIVLPDCIDFSQAQLFAARIQLHRKPNSCKLYIETAAKEGTKAWNTMRFGVRAVELVLMRFPGVDTDRYITTNSGGQTLRLNLSSALKELQCNGWMENSTTKPTWVPVDCDFDWYVRKAWNDSHCLVQLQNALVEKQQLDQMDNKLSAVQRMMIIGEKNREVPVLWTAEYFSTAIGSTIRVKMLSDLSTRCFHDPIEINALPESVGKYGDWIQMGLSIFSTVKLTNGVIDVSDGTELKTRGVIDTTTENRPSVSQSRDLLCELLDLYCNEQLKRPHDSRDVRRLSNLECGILESGNHVWATREEIDNFDGITLRTDLSYAELSTHPTGSLQCLLTVRRVMGMTDWNWRKAFVEWRLVHEAGTLIESGRTPSNSDKSKEPEWSDEHQFVVDSLETFREMRLTAVVKRPHRWCWALKTLGKGSSEIADALPRDSILPSSSRIVIPLGNSGKVECDLKLQQ
ncbi:Leucine-rich repeat serine/threonine-protein kinase 2 [Phytophthora citrophthora]|uniref:Leucine-rich repeat serine/threonine-protein kinase 2 n=1 Tax=Phytophthora citrophthora TaxID=4793 RepID=A0AAD9GR58_9STRA|nr:Leucine-rich repeat serine/threonine-protein kinase 2 [Phytophthora citrophthora]